MVTERRDGRDSSSATSHENSSDSTVIVGLVTSQPLKIDCLGSTTGQSHCSCAEATKDYEGDTLLSIIFHKRLFPDLRKVDVPS